MKSLLNVVKLLGVLSVGLGLLAGCGSTTYINVNYQLPAVSNDLPNEKVFLEYRDDRSETAFLSASARGEFKYFTDIFSLTLTGSQEPNLVGSFNAASLFKEAFKRRLNSNGLEVTASRAHGLAVMEIILEDFFLDLKDRKWIARIKFTTRLTGAGGRTASQTVSASAERTQTVGRGAAETVLGEIFTAAVNDVKLSDLFEKAGL